MPLFIGDYRSFKFQNIIFSALVTNINSDSSPRQQKRVIVSGFLDPVNNNYISSQQANVLNGVTSNGVKSFLADQIVPNLKIVDSEDTTRAEIVSVKKTPGTISTVQNGKYITLNDPTTTHVEIALNMLADKVGDSYFFQNEQSLNIGNNIFFSFFNVKVILTVTSVSDIN
jgi:hypothetical protein